MHRANILYESSDETFQLTEDINGWDIRAKAEDLRERFPNTFAALDVDAILFAVTVKGAHYATHKIFSPKERAIFLQLTAHPYKYLITVNTALCEEFNVEQLTLLLYHEMRHLLDGNSHSEEWIEIRHRFGQNWQQFGGVVDITSEDFDWQDKRQLRLFTPQAATAEAAEG